MLLLCGDHRGSNLAFGLGGGRNNGLVGHCDDLQAPAWSMRGERRARRTGKARRARRWRGEAAAARSAPLHWCVVLCWDGMGWDARRWRRRAARTCCTCMSGDGQSGAKVVRRRCSCGRAAAARSRWRCGAGGRARSRLDHSDEFLDRV